MEKNKSFLLDIFKLSHRKPGYLETIFSLRNGHIGVRAGNPEAFFNGFLRVKIVSMEKWHTVMLRSTKR